MAERKQLIEAYLALYRKQLDRAHLERIASAEACANPLYLRVLLEELRLFGMQERLADRIEHYLNAPTMAALYQKLLERMEVDYDPARRGVWQLPQERTGGMVGDALALVWGARRGLAASELLDLLGSPPRADWSPLFLVLEDALVEQRDVLNFFHNYLRKAVEARYLPDGDRRKSTRLRLAGYFDQRLRAGGTAAPEGRTLDELPWLWRQAGEWHCLYDLLADLNLFTALWQKDAFEVKTGWAVVEANSPLRKTAAYDQVLQHPGEH